jgi:hypothetical protein
MKPDPLLGLGELPPDDGPQACRDGPHVERESVEEGLDRKVAGDVDGTLGHR